MSDSNLGNLDFQNFWELKKYFSGENSIFLTDDNIGFHESISNDVIDNITNITNQLDSFIYDFFHNHDFDYHENSQNGCYILSSLFCLSDSSWNLVQGEYKFQNKKHPFYHSWLEKEEIVYDPAMRVVTPKRLYENYFNSKYHYEKEELIKLLKRTATFTYYEEDLQRGCINPLGQLFYYDTKNAELAANKILNSLDIYFHQKTK